jgi:hypothetical protein
MRSEFTERPGGNPAEGGKASRLTAAEVAAAVEDSSLAEESDPVSTPVHS